MQVPETRSDLEESSDVSSDSGAPMADDPFCVLVQPGWVQPSEVLYSPEYIEKHIKVCQLNIILGFCVRANYANWLGMYA